MRYLLLCLTALALLVPSQAFAADVIDHAPFEALLKKYVDGKGRVAYAKWRSSEGDRAALKTYVSAVGDADLKGYGEKARLAFYVNAYNATVLESVLSQWPVKSVMKVDGFFDKQRHEVAGESITLDHLENKTIRPTFKDARVHFVLVCAAKSCPRLRRQALTEANLDKVMTRAAREFITGATTIEGGAATTSKLFEWFKADFEHAAGSVPKYLARYHEDKEASEKLASGKLELKFREYDWGINAR